MQAAHSRRLHGRDKREQNKKARMDNRPILLVEDNPDDQLLTQVAFERSKVGNRLIIVDNGESALDFLLRRGKYSERPVADSPALVLLDVNLPGMSGFDVLDAIRAHPQAKVQPIIMLTSSDRDEDILRAYEAGVNAYMRKPVEIGAFVKAIADLSMFWVVLNRNPAY
jgi:CheY-like chemotaxis protein